MFTYKGDKNTEIGWGSKTGVKGFKLEMAGNKLHSDILFTHRGTKNMCDVKPKSKEPKSVLLCKWYIKKQVGTHQFKLF